MVIPNSSSVIEFLKSLQLENIYLLVKLLDMLYCFEYE